MFVNCDTTDGNFSQVWYSTSDADLGVIENLTTIASVILRQLKKTKCDISTVKNRSVIKKVTQKSSVIF
jgi:hypothetical protein